MPRRIKFPHSLFIIFLTLAAAFGAFAQTSSQNVPGGQPQSGQAAPAQPQSQPGQVTTEPAPPAPNQPGDTVQIPSGSGNVGQVEQEGEVFTLRKEVEEVTLHATVIDAKNRMVTNLDKNAFQVYEDGQPQAISSFRREDIPVSLGILIDNSGSMRDKRAAVNQAAMNLIRHSKPEDEIFVVNFHDEAYIDQDFTGDQGKLKEALEKIESRGGTAMYDAVIAAANHLSKSGTKQKKVLLVVTDGEDNNSRQTLEQAIRRVQDENGPTIYSIGILGDKNKRARRALSALALQTGGIYFFPEDATELDQITTNVSRDIRSQYTIGYKPTNPQERGGYRQVRVEAKAGRDKLQVRTRSGYYARQQRASN